MKKKSKVIILGSGSFVLSEFLKILEKKKIHHLKTKKSKIDLTKKNSVNKIKKLIKNGDKLIFASAIAPVKSFKMFNDNLKICKNVLAAIKNKKIDHLIYISSDAVYSDSLKLINENSITSPNNLHGLMHLVREEMIKSTVSNVCVVRPTLVYGSNDPHNGYGPNQFIRLGQLKKKIKLFGKGQEKRDHIHVRDVGEILYLLLKKRYVGKVNIVTGKTRTFNKIAEKVSKTYGNGLSFIRRNGPIPHKGYRAFNNLLLRKLINKKNFIDVLDWIGKKEKYKRV